jgi:hypothetical protein
VILADHATNVEDDVYFIVEAQMIKHEYVKYLFGEIGESEKDEDKD